MEFTLKEWITPDEFPDLICENRLIIDVRSEIEFAEGHFPNSLNLPILSTSERHEIGILYKQEGPDAAIKRGHELVQGEVKHQRLAAWVQALTSSPHSVLTCFRGGLRSQIAQSWCRDAGVEKPRLQGGTKALRQFLLQQAASIIPNRKLIVLCGPTGAGKTPLLRALQSLMPVLDLEQFAEHRGSAFGGFGRPQPSQILFENRLASELVKIRFASPVSKSPILVEDESRMIGQRTLPEVLFTQMKTSPAVVIEEPLEDRVESTFAEYILATPLAGAYAHNAGHVFTNYRTSIQKISRKLGGLQTREILDLLEQAETEFNKNGNLDINRLWIRQLLRSYYDPFYQNGIERRSGPILFKGPKKEVMAFLCSELSRSV